jgi:hypothetical protein
LGPWLLNFSTLITASPPTYGLSAGDAVVIAGYYSAWIAAYTLATDPTTRSHVTVTNKNAVKASILPSIRGYAQQIVADLGVLNSDKVALGLNPPNNSRSPIPAPVSNPLIELTCAAPGSQGMRYSDVNTPASKKKPFGSIALQLYRATGTDVVTDPSLMEFIGPFTRNPVMVTNEANQAGQLASYAARWVTRKGLVGPWSPVISGYLV